MPPTFRFEVLTVESVPYATQPLLALGVKVETTPGLPIRSLTLQAQIRIKASQRNHRGDDQAGLLDLFGTRERWGDTVKSLFWHRVETTCPPFVGETEVALHLPCTFDFNVAVTKYLHALKGGHIPIELLFGGTVFYKEGEGPLQIARIPWECEAAYDLSVSVWQEMMDHYYPNTAWVTLSRDAFQALHHYRSRAGLPTWEAALEQLLRQAQDKDPPA